MKEINCNIVRDLLPSYIEGLVSEETNQEIKKHLEECAECSHIFEEMSYGEESESKSAAREINYLKKLKHKTRKIVLIIFAVLLLSGIAAFACYGYFGISTDGYSAENISIDLDKNILEADISLSYGSYGITKVEAEECNGAVTLKVFSTSPVFKKNNTYELRCQVSGDVSQIKTSSGQILWECGVDIPKKINDIYNAKVKYIGDNSAVGKLLTTIDLCSTLNCSNYSIHLITDKQPYGLEIYDIRLNDDMFYSLTNKSYEESIKSCAYLILACVENLDFVEFNYTAPHGAEKTYKLTVDEANENLSIVIPDKDAVVFNSIKNWSDSCWSLKILMETVSSQLSYENDLKYTPYFDATSNETVALLSFTPIDEKYNHILNNEISDLISECENSYNWGKAYTKQYKVIYKALLDYVKTNSAIKDNQKQELLNTLKEVENYYKYNDKLSKLYLTVEETACGSDCRLYLNSKRYFREAREKTLPLAECAYLLGVEFEWIS